MREVRKSMIQAGFVMGRTLTRMASHRPDLDQVRRWLPLAAVLVVAGCSWFDEEPTPPTPTEKSGAEKSGGEQAKATPAPGEGEAMGGDQEAKVPDINSVPNEAPKSSIVNLDQAQEGLGSDSGNSQHTDETLTMPEQSAARPEKPGAEGTEATAQVEPVAPETPQGPPAITPDAQTPSAPVVEQPAPAPVQVATTGTPQPGAKPFEPNGPLNLVPGSLARNEGEAATANVPTGIAATSLQPPPSAPAGSEGGVSVDYSALDGLQSGMPTGFPSNAGMAPAPMPAPIPSGAVAGVGQAVGYVYFGNGSNALTSADRQVLQQVAQLQRIQGGVLRIIGHASARTGNIDALTQDQVNRKVSLARATAVARALVAMGVQPILVQVAAAGDDQTLYAESTPAGEAGNRRAEVYLSQN
jgi:outer membrane protein OmpA-like peptidoglycan-associated protein